MTSANYRLLTNISLIQMGTPVAVTLHCHALLLEVPIAFDDKPPRNGQIRGFRTDGSMPVFTHWLKCKFTEYEAKSASNPNIVISTSNSSKTLFTGHNITFKDGTLLSLIAADRNTDLQVTDYDDINQVWEDLPHKVLQHWQHPSFPVRCYLPCSQVAKYLSQFAA